MPAPSPKRPDLEGLRDKFHGLPVPEMKWIKSSGGYPKEGFQPFKAKSHEHYVTIVLEGTREAITGNMVGIGRAAAAAPSLLDWCLHLEERVKELEERQNTLNQSLQRVFKDAPYAELQKLAKDLSDQAIISGANGGACHHTLFKSAERVKFFEDAIQDLDPYACATGD